MAVVIVEPPAALVSPDEAKVWAPALAGDTDDRLTALLAAAQSAIEPPSRWNASFGRQTLCCFFDRWPGERGVRLPYGPATEIVSIDYVGSDGSEVTLDDATYHLAAPGTIGARLILKYDQSWPDASMQQAAVRVTYRAGYEASDPKLASVKQAIILGAMQLHSIGTRELALRSVEVPGVATKTWTVSDAASALVEKAVEGLLGDFRVWSA